LLISFRHLIFSIAFLFTFELIDLIRATAILCALGVRLLSWQLESQPIFTSLELLALL